MKISELIQYLEQIKLEMGDLEVDRYAGCGERINQPRPIIAFRKILKPRQKREDFAFVGDKEEIKGEMVCKL